MTETNMITRMMDDIASARESGRAVKQKGGKLYTMVQDRVEIFRRVAGDGMQIQTELVQWSPEPGGLIVVRAVIRSGTGQTIATGHAEEIRGANYINETSALENCETSAIGRALAVLGLHGGEFASAEEIQIANEKRQKMADIRASVPPVPPVAPPVQADLVEEAEKAGGKKAGLTEPSTLKDVPADIVAAVDFLDAGTPVLKKSDDAVMLEACFKFFVPLCNTVDEAYSFWHRNEPHLVWLKKNSPDTHEAIRKMFVEHKNKLTKAKKK